MWPKLALDVALPLALTRFFRCTRFTSPAHVRCTSDFVAHAVSPSVPLCVCVCVQNHQGVCPQESVYCENKCGARMMRRLLSQHSLAECPKRTQPCKYCGKEFVFDTIQVSLLKTRRSHLARLRQSGLSRY